MKYPAYRINSINKSLCDATPMSGIPPCEVRENRIQEVSYEKIAGTQDFKVTYIGVDGTEYSRTMTQKEIHQQIKLA